MEKLIKYIILNNNMKKAFIRTLEVLVAVVITFIFVVYIIPKNTSDQSNQEELQLLAKLSQNPDFRVCALNKDLACVNTYIKDNIPQKYDYKMDIIINPNQPLPDLPLKQIFTDSLLISGTLEEYNPTTIKLYYWLK